MWTIPSEVGQGAMSEKQALPVLSFAAVLEWEEWLGEHHDTSGGLWLKIAKKGSGITTISYAEALDGALCFGWIDGQKAAFDERFWLQRFTPRGPRSKWSRINRDRAEQLAQEGRMKPAGLAQVERARADGRWESAYEGQWRATVPEDLQRALDLNPRARAFFETLDNGNRYAILYRVQDAKRPETRARRIAQYIAMLAEQRKIHP
jgi:uncharacterized protein YdeI (YjbR/CyaY-like superfamily)